MPHRLLQETSRLLYSGKRVAKSNIGLNFWTMSSSLSQRVNIRWTSNRRQHLLRSFTFKTKLKWEFIWIEKLKCNYDTKNLACKCSLCLWTSYGLSLYRSPAEGRSQFFFLIQDIKTQNNPEFWHQVWRKWLRRCFTTFQSYNCLK